MKVMFISSMGGHLNELLQLKELFDEVDYRIVTEKTKATEYLAERYPGKVDYLVYGTKHHLFSYLFIFAFNILKSLVLFLKFRPRCVITTGTHTAVPMCYIARLFGAKVVWIETFANAESKTVAGRLVYPIANLFIVQWEKMLELYPKAVYGGWIF